MNELGYNLKVECITPEIATQLLSVKAKKRPIGDTWVRIIQKEMDAGSWNLQGMGISIGPNGVAGNGNHQLSAIQKLGKPVKLPVRRYFDDASFVEHVKVCDDIRKRKIGHNWEINGSAPPGKGKDYQSIVSAILSFCNKKESTFSPSLMDMALEMAADDIAAIRCKMPGEKYRTGILASAFVLMRYLNPSRVDELARLVHENDKLSKNSPEHALHKYMTETAPKLTKGGSKRLEVQAHVLNGIWKYLNNDSVSNLKTSSEVEDKVRKHWSRLCGEN